MKNFIVRNNSGEILRTGYCQDSDLLLQAGIGETVEENTGDWSDDTHYYNGTAYTTRSDFSIAQDKTAITADNIDKATFTGIPVGTTVQGVTVNDGVLEFSTNEVGTHYLQFINPPVYKPILLTVEAQ